MTLLLWEYNHSHTVLMKGAAVLRQTNGEIRRAFLVQNIPVCKARNMCLSAARGQLSD